MSEPQVSRVTPDVSGHSEVLESSREKPKLLRRVGMLFKLTKPSIMLLVLFTGAAALVIEGSFLARPVDFVLVMLGLYCTGGAANALNQYFERDIDARMRRTSKRRPLPAGEISARAALFFAVGLGMVGLILFFACFNGLSALLSLGTIVFYSLIYTLWLKPNTHQNIVIGGAAGAMGPVIAWAAATNGLSMTPWILFLIIFFWTPPHFWALALCFKDDYREAKLPMLPVVRGDEATLRQIFNYSIVLVVISLCLSLPSLLSAMNRLLFPNYTIFGLEDLGTFGVGQGFGPGSGWVYLYAALVLGGVFIRRAYQAKKMATTKSQWRLFGYSIVYLFALFSAMMMDALTF